MNTLDKYLEFVYGDMPAPVARTRPAKIWHKDDEEFKYNG